MCEAEGELRECEDDLDAEVEKNKKLRQELSDLKEEIKSMYHFDECFKITAGCVCAKRFC